MRTLCTVMVALLAVGAVSAAAQSGSGAEVALNYTYVHSNAPPGGCGCFSWNGGSASAAWHVNSSFAGVADFGAVHAGNYDSSGFSPTMVSYLFGPRYTYRELYTWLPADMLPEGWSSHKQRITRALGWRRL